MCVYEYVRVPLAAMTMSCVYYNTYYYKINVYTRGFFSRGSIAYRTFFSFPTAIRCDQKTHLETAPSVLRYNNIIGIYIYIYIIICACAFMPAYVIGVVRV